MFLRRIAQPALEPVSVAEAMAHLRVTDSADASYIAALITAAREWVEAVSWRALIRQVWELRLDAWPTLGEILLPFPPLIGVSAFSWVDEDGQEHEVSASTYVVDTFAEPGRIRLRPDACWPAGTLYPAGGVRIRYAAGYGDSAEDVPRPLRHAILLLVGHLYENREATGREMKELPLGVEALIMPYRTLQF